MKNEMSSRSDMSTALSCESDESLSLHVSLVPLGMKAVHDRMDVQQSMREAEVPRGNEVREINEYLKAS